MSHPKTPADYRNEHAADRDDAADRRDSTAHDRDEAANQRDAAAAARDQAASQDSHDLVAQLQRLGEQILARFDRIENATIDPTAWPDLTPAALAHLAAHTAEQRRLAGLDRAAVHALLDQLNPALGRIRQDRHAGAADRRASARDRHHAAHDRVDSGHDREDSALDRSQDVIEREQIDPRDLPQAGAVDPSRARPGRRRRVRNRSISPSEQAIATSQQRITASQEKLTRTRSPRPPNIDAAPSDPPQD